MFLEIRIVGTADTELIHGGKIKVGHFGFLQYFGTICGADKFTVGIEQFKRVPLAGIVACRDDYSPGGLLPGDGNLDSRCGGKAEINNVKAEAGQGLYNKILDHLTAYPSIASDDDFSVVGFFKQPASECSCKSYDIERC